MKKLGPKIAILGLLLIILVTNGASGKDQDMLLPVKGTYVDGRTFTVPGDYTAKLAVNAKVRADLGVGVLKGSYVASSAWAGGVTTVHLHDAILTNPISGIWVAAMGKGLLPDGNGEVNALDYAGGTPSLSGLQAAVRAIGGSNRTLRLPSGTWPITDDFTIPANLTLKPERGAILSVATGKTLTINGGYEAGLYQSFSCTGTGKVVFGIGAVENSYPEWWGAYSDGTNAAATYAAIQAAINAGHATVHLSAYNGNYNIGTTGLSIDYAHSMDMKMAVGSRITYTGTEAPITINTTNSAMNGLRLDLFDIYSSGKYVIKITGGTSGDKWDHYCQSFIIRANEFWHFTDSAIYVDCQLTGGDIEVQNIHAPSPYTAWGFYFTPGIVDTENEDVRLKFIHSGKRAAYLPAGWNYGRLDIDVDSTSEDNTYTDIELGGNFNQIIIRASAPGSRTYTFNRPLWIKSGAYGNTILASPYTLKGLLDDTPMGDNTYGGMPGTENFLSNGSFESFDAGGPIDWRLSNATATRETTVFRHGKSGIKVVSAGAYAATIQPIPSSLIGETMTFSGWFMAPSTNAKTAVMGLAGLPYGSAVIPKDDSWHFLSVTGIVPNPADYIYIYANSTSSGAGDIVYVDGCSFTKGSSPVFPESGAGNYIYSKATWDPGSVNDGAMTSTTVGCIGAAVGDPVSVGFSQAVPAGAILSGSVTSADTVTVTLFNKTGAPMDLVSGTLKVVVRKTEN